MTSNGFKRRTIVLSVIIINNNPTTLQTQKLTSVYLEFPNYTEEIVQVLIKVTSVLDMSK